MDEPVQEEGDGWITLTKMSVNKYVLKTAAARKIHALVVFVVYEYDKLRFTVQYCC